MLLSHRLHPAVVIADKDVDIRNGYVVAGHDDLDAGLRLQRRTDACGQQGVVVTRHGAKRSERCAHDFSGGLKVGKTLV